MTKLVTVVCGACSTELVTVPRRWTVSVYLGALMAHRPGTPLQLPVVALTTCMWCGARLCMSVTWAEASEMLNRGASLAAQPEVGV